LVREQFYAMFHIILKIIKSGNSQQIPKTLPECLHNDVVQRIGTIVTKRVKKIRKEKRHSNKNKNTMSITNKKSSSLLTDHTFSNASVNDSENFPIIESGNEIVVQSNEKEKERGIKPQETKIIGEDEEWANFDF